jgi:hypothetical protein
MRTMLATLAVALSTMAQPAVNFSGKWTVAVQGDGGRGRGAAPTLTINQIGDTVTGELVGGGGGGGGSAAPINNKLYDGKVENGTLTFYVWRGTDKPCKTSYKGTLNAAGDEITFTVTGAPGRGGLPAGPQTIVAKRVR